MSSRTIILFFTITIFLVSIPVSQSTRVTCGDWYTVGFIQQKNCTVEIEEWAPEGTLVFDASTEMETASYLYTTISDTDVNFRTSNSESELYTRRTLDREAMVTRATAPYPVTISTSIVDLVSVARVIKLTIRVLDRNDNSPRFKRGLNFLESPYFSFTRYESSSLDSVLTLEAVDYDEGENGTALVELVQPEPEMFNISVIYEGGRPTTVYVVPMAPLDRETQSNYTFDVIAYEGTTNPANFTLRVNLTVLDVNDNQPRFNQTEYSTSVNEMQAINSSLILVSATDADIGNNALIKYSINEVCAKSTKTGSCININEPWPFALDTESGLLRVSEMLNYEEMVEYRLTVDAYNPTQMQAGSSTALVNIEVLDVNDNAPSVTDFDVAVPLTESSLVNSIYATFRVQDADSPKFSQFRLSLLDNVTGINSTTFGLKGSQLFSVVLLQTVDREERETYNLTLLAQDLLNSSLYTTFNFSVSVLDINDHSPVFNPVPDPVVIREEEPIATFVVQVSATDEDIGTNAEIHYSIPPSSPDLPYQTNFTIEAVTGRILVAHPLDRETTPTLFICVTATDNNGNGRSTNLTVNINLTDINDNSPVVTTTVPSQINVFENASTGYLVIDIDAFDRDEGTNAVIDYQLAVISPSLSSPPPFVINSSNGRVTVDGTLDRETISEYSLRVTVSDGNHTGERVNFTIRVLDVNDNAPSFPASNYYRTLHENVTIGSHVINLTATDPDSTQYTSIRYLLVQANPHFSLNQDTGEIVTASSLDWETQPVYYLILRAYDGFGMYSENVNLTVSVVDVNDEIPQFIGSPFLFSVPEDALNNTIVDTVTVKSVEQGINGHPLFYIDSPDVPFVINGSGVIFTTGGLNREVTDRYDVIVRVADLAPPPHYNTTTVTIMVSDVNDNPPIFKSNFVGVSLSEIHAVNSPFYTAHATDADIAPNNVTQYSLAAGTTGFQIDPDTGDLSLTTSLNYEVQQSVLVNIKARDSGKPNLFVATQAVNITVLDDNNTNITFPGNFPLEYTLSEDAPLDFVIVNFTGQDHKGNPKLNLNYYLTNASGVTPLEFGIEREPQTGYALLSVTASLDRERTHTYSLNITISDGNTPPSVVTQFLSIEISDINDNSPSFSSQFYSFSFEEEVQGVRKLGEVSATDPDAGANSTIRYSLQDDFSGLFSIDSINGDVYQQRALDRETSSNYSLTVIASDQGTPSRQSQASVLIIVTDINDNSPTFSPVTAQLDENAHVGTVVTTLVGADADEGSNGKVTFIYNTQTSNASSHFELYSNGTIVVTQVPDYEMNTHFIFFVTAQDGGSPSPKKTFGNITITLNDLNDNCPVFVGPASRYNVSVMENATSGTPLLRVEARDYDQGEAGIVRYVFENIADMRSFTLDGQSGEITLLAELDYETKSHYEVGILAYDQGRPRNRICRQSIHISVVNVNEYDPSFDDTWQFVFRVNEGQSAGAFVGTIRAYDGDSDSVLTFSLSPSLAFTINSNSGEIRTIAQLDYETQMHYNLTVTVSDEGGRSSQAFVSIHVGNVNDHTPSFETGTYIASVSEAATNGTVFISLTATDSDNRTNTPVTYSIVGGNVGGVFGVEPKTGDVFVNGMLDYETIEGYVLSIRARDTGTPTRSVTANIIVTVLNYNEYAPQFSNSSYYFNVSENLPPGTFVGKVSASDSDTGSYGDVAYSLGSHASLFEISETSGVIQTLVPLDREAMPTLSPLVVVANDSNKTQSVNVFITVLDVNDNSPYFPNSLYQYSLNISSPNGTVIGTVSAVDPDLSPLTHYSLLNSSGLPVTINPSTGSLVVSAAPLSLANTPYEFVVMATDGLNSSFTAQTLVRLYTATDNDHYPNFTQAVYETTVSENFVPSQPIAYPMATDPDTGSNGLRKYSLHPNGSLTRDQFSIDELNGELSLTQALDYEQAKSHDIVVYVRDDTPSHPRTATARVIVNVVNENDNAPTLVGLPSSLTLSYIHYTDTQFLRLAATDPDNSTVTFQLWTQTNKFSVNPVTGAVTNIIVLNTTVTYSLTFRVTDGNFTTSDTMTLNIVAPPQNMPSFPDGDSVLSLSVAESAGVGTLISTIAALNSPTSYHLVCCDEAFSVFSVNPSSGALTVSGPLDFESQEEYRLIVEARKVSQSGTRYSDYQQVTMSVTNINEYTPTFNPLVNPVRVNENRGSNSLIVQVLAVDSDSGSYGVISYQIIDGNTNQSLSINSSNGAIRVSTGKILNHETIPYYSLLVRAQDGGGKQSTITVNIVVLDVNDSPPIFSGNYTTEVYEPGSIGDRVLRVIASDADSTSILTYQLGTVHSYLGCTSKGTSNKFSLGSTTGFLTLAGVLDRETADRYEFIIKASDGRHFDTTHVTINVLDVNDNAPSFMYNTYRRDNFPELSLPGTYVIEVIARDTDSPVNAMIRYSLAQNWPTNKFTINEYTGVIRVNEPMSVEEILNVSKCSSDVEFTAYVNASDGFWNDTVSVTVSFIDVNKNPPIFLRAPYNIVTSEATPIGTVLLTMHVNDSDCGANAGLITTFPDYYFRPRDLFGFPVVESNKAYNLTTKALLPQGIYHFRLEAYNNRPSPDAPLYYKASYAHVTVTVLPNNAHAPVFDEVGSLSVYENSPLREEIGYIRAIDHDLGVSGQVSYWLNNSDVHVVPFSINNSTGLLRVNGTLDYEKKAIYNLTVFASDSGYPVRVSSLFIQVDVLDRDDNRPIFKAVVYNGNISENSSLHSKVLELDVTDADSSINVRYTIINEDSLVSSLPFTLNPQSGVLSTSGLLDYETQKKYRFSVMGASTSNPSLNSTAMVKISVLGANEFAPVLKPVGPTVTVLRNASKGDVVVTVNASDEDDGRDGEVSFSFQMSSPYLAVHGNGSITLNMSLNDIHVHHRSASSKTVGGRKRQANDTDVVVHLVVVATDGGSPPMNDTAKLTVVIPESVGGTSSPKAPASLTTEIIIIMSSVASALIIVILVTIICISTVFSHSRKLKKSTLNISATAPHHNCDDVVPREEEDASQHVELQHVRVTESVTPTKTGSTNLLNKSINETSLMSSEEEGHNIYHGNPQRPSLYTRSTSDLASSVATETLNLTQDATGYPYTKGQIEAIFAANMDLLHDGSQASVHTFGSEGGGESDGDELDTAYYTKYATDIDAEECMIEGEDDLSSLGKDRNSMISESSDGGREEEYHFSQSTNPWSSRRSINDLVGDGSHGHLYGYTHHSQGIAGAMPYGTSTQGSSTSLLRGHRPHPQYRVGSERDLPRQLYGHSHRVGPHPPIPPLPTMSNYEYFPEHEPHHPPSSFRPRMLHSQRYESPSMDYRGRSSVPRGRPPPAYFTQDPMHGHHSLTQGSSTRGDNYYGQGFPELPFERQTLSTSSTSLSTSASHPNNYRPNGGSYR